MATNDVHILFRSIGLPEDCDCSLTVKDSDGAIHSVALDVLGLQTRDVPTGSRVQSLTVDGDEIPFEYANHLFLPETETTVEVFLREGNNGQLFAYIRRPAEDV